MVLWLTGLMGPAWGVAPTPYQGEQPVRVYTHTRAGQTAFRRTPAWQRFLETEGAGWEVRADERAGTPRRMWGRLPLVEPGAGEGDVVEALRDFTRRNAELLGTTDPPLRASGYDADRDLWFVEFAPERDGVPIWRGALTYRVKHGNLVLAGADTYPNTPTRGAFLLSDAAAREAAVRGGLAPEAAHRRGDVLPVWLPRIEEGLLVLRAALEVHSSTATPRGEWVTFVDAASGDVLAAYNDVRYFTGTLGATHDDRHPGNGTTFSLVKDGAVGNGTTSTRTDANGVFTLPDAPSYQASFLSTPIRIEDDLGNQALTFTGADPTPTWNIGNGSIAAIDTFVYLTEVRDVFNLVVPNESFTFGNLQGTVNIDDSCNAFYVGGTVNFFRSGQGCQNTGRLADVIYHEWGHGFHDFRIVTGFFDGALSEGAGDVTSFLLTGDPDMAPGFFVGGGVLRSAQNNKVYPTDLVNQVHEDGEIFSGAMWRTHQNLEAAFGTTYARDTTREIFSGLLQGGPDLDGSIDEALVADDDDGDLSNGTPHSCHIVPGFAAHGLGQLGAQIVDYAAGHAPIATAAGDRPIAIEAEVVGPPGCANDFAAGTATVHWRADGGAWSSSPLTATGLDITGSIPAQPIGTFVEYHLEIAGGGRTLAAPGNGELNPFSFYVGEVIEVHCDDFEGSDGGYTHALINGTPTDGANDWQHGAPNGRGGDPQTAHSGANVWGNDLGWDNFNGLYQAEKNNRLTGPVVDLGHYRGAVLHYWRWLQVEDGRYDQASILANGVQVWRNRVDLGEAHHRDDQWAPHAVDLGDVEGSVQIAFDLASDGGLEMGGWTIDDVCIHVPATADNRLGVTDFTAGEGGTGTVTLAWTNPVHLPLREVRVVRTSGACPTSVDDGEVVYYADEPVAGAAITVEDAVPTTDTYCYGVFPGDGSASLGWAVEGWNVDTGSADIPATEEQIEESEEENGVAAWNLEFGEIEQGCGCRSSSGAVGGWIVLAAVIGARRRRREPNRHRGVE
jgi:hypothetical protein